MTAPKPTAIGKICNGYGYLWWIVESKDYSAYAAIGDGGNIIFVCPQKELVISIASSFKPRAKDRIQLMNEHIVPRL